MNEIDLLQYNSEENTEQTPEKPKKKKKHCYKCKH